MGEVLEAGSELDALVAEKVMEWKPSRTDGCWIKQGPFEGCDCPSHDERHDFRPSIDIATAWEVVEKFNFIYLYRHTAKDPQVDQMWECKLVWDEPTEHPRKFYAVADTAPLSICRAAIAAIERT